ncbi:hypothetical protein QTN25_008374 [Entamoeba marina]
MDPNINNYRLEFIWDNEQFAKHKGIKSNANDTICRIVKHLIKKSGQSNVWLFYEKVLLSNDYCIGDIVKLFGIQQQTIKFRVITNDDKYG